MKFWAMKLQFFSSGLTQQERRELIMIWATDLLKDVATENYGNCAFALGPAAEVEWLWIITERHLDKHRNNTTLLLTEEIFFWESIANYGVTERLWNLVKRLEKTILLFEQKLWQQKITSFLWTITCDLFASMNFILKLKRLIEKNIIQSSIAYWKKYVEIISSQLLDENFSNLIN